VFQVSSELTFENLCQKEMVSVSTESRDLVKRRRRRNEFKEVDADDENWEKQVFIKLQHTATLCNTLQHTATHFDTLQRTPTHCHMLHHTLQHAALHTATSCTARCDALQHTTKHSNKLQYAAMV